METLEFNALLQECIEQDKKIGDAKGADYTIGSSDRLNNFKTVGELVCCPHCQKPVGPRAVWAVYLLKHMLALLAWVKTGKVESEGLAGRIYDVRLYGALGLAIAKEQASEGVITAYEINQNLDALTQKAMPVVEVGPGVRDGSVWHQLGVTDRRVGPQDRRHHCDRTVQQHRGGGLRGSVGRRSYDVDNPWFFRNGW